MALSISEMLLELPSGALDGASSRRDAFPEVRQTPFAATMEQGFVNRQAAGEPVCWKVVSGAGGGEDRDFAHRVFILKQQVALMNCSSAFEFKRKI